MITHEYEGPTGFVVSVSVTSPPAPKVTFLERIVLKFGSGERVIRFCNALNIGCCAIALAWIVTWFVWLRGIVVHAMHLTLAEAFFMSTAWIPLMVLQVAIMGVRYGVFTLQLKATQQIAEASSETFFRGVNTVVAHAVRTYMDDRPEPEKPTVQ